MEQDLFCRISSEFAERLKELAEERGIGIRQLSLQTGIGVPTLYQYLEKKHFPRLPNLIAIADFFSCSLDFLLGFKDSPAGIFHPCPPFSERFPQLLRLFGLSRYALCKQLDLSPSLVYYWQTGQKLPTAEHLALLSLKFRYSVDFLLGREG